MSPAGNDRVWFITGASSGLGRKLADTAVDWGDRVVVTARDAGALRDFERQHHGRVLAAELDVRNPDQAHDAIGQAMDEFGRVDVAVNNAGFGLFGPLEEIAGEELRRGFDTNVFGAVNVLRAVLPVMRAQRSGHIVQISSLEGVAPVVAGESAYSGTKFAVEGIHEALAKEVAHLGIGVTIVEPGPIRTEFASGAVVTQPRDPDYADSVGKALQWFADLAGNQPNDPARVATAIMLAVDSPEAPLRLPLGEEAIEAIREKLDGQLADLDRWERVGAATATRA